ncbi:MAG: hypothetical protein ACRDPH_05930 [Marmoricola sp.]
MRNTSSLVLAVAVPAVLASGIVSGCGDQGASSAGHHAAAAAKSASASPSDSPGSSQGASPSDSPTTRVGKQGTCNLLFHGHSPLIARSMRMAISPGHGLAADTAKVQETAAALSAVAVRAGPSWQPSIRNLARTLPEVARPRSSHAQQAAFWSAHRKVVKKCTPYVD